MAETEEEVGTTQEECLGGCGAIVAHQWADFFSGACDACSKRYPPSLIKACVDPLDYALKLRTGEVIRFEVAAINGGGEWVTLTNCSGLEHECPRGVDVRISDIVWCADAPDGS